MRILTALTYYRPHYSGLTIYAERVARALAKRGHQVTVLTSRYDPQLAAHEVQNGVTIIRPNVWFRISKGVIMPSMPYKAWVELQKADILHLHIPQLDAAILSVLSHVRGVPVVLTYHCDLQLPSGFVHKIANLASNIANHITARSSDVIVTNTLDYAENSSFLSRYIYKVQPLLPPIDLVPVSEADIQAFKEKFHIQPQQRIIGMAARLAAEKGVEYLARALPLVLEKHPSSRVLFVGPYQNVVGEERYVQRLSPLIDRLDDHWTFVGILSPVEMSAFFHVCEVTVLPSINSTESYGMVQVESMSCSTPVVASDLPGVRIPVTETGSGLIVPPADANELANALIEILNDPHRYRGHPEVIVQPSSPDHVAEAYERIYKGLLSDKLGD